MYLKKLVRDWKKAALDIDDVPQAKQARRWGKPTFPQEEKQIKEWIYTYTVNKAILLCVALSA